LLKRFGLPGRIFRPVVPPGNVLDVLTAEVASRTACARLPVINVGSHDTASAVAAVPAEDREYIFLSSGTWSLMGVETGRAILTPQALECGFTNEAGTNDKRLFLKNITGLWLLQECRREWCQSEPQLTYDSLTQAAAGVPAFSALIHPGDDRFLPAGDMPGRIRAFCRDTGQTIPQSRGEIVRCILESLALEYRRTADQLSGLLDSPLPVIHIIGGGARNRLLNQFAANAARRTVIAGPVEATALGNVIGQAVATGHLSWEEGRAFVRRTENPARYSPADGAAWEEAYARFLGLGRTHPVVESRIDRKRVSE
jgi:sugar (pentulose or hexulose) kinase